MEWTENMIIEFALFHASRMKGVYQSDSEFYAHLSLQIFKDNRNSIVRENLMRIKGYTPYCGNNMPRNTILGCDNPRMKFNGKQFVCPRCSGVTNFPAEFIEEYKKKWNL